jgi:hypothetical protein
VSWRRLGRLAPCFGLALLAALGPRSALAWPADFMEILGRDARRALPLSLARLLSEREEVILERVARFPPELTALVTTDLVEGRLRPGTLEALDAEAAAIASLLRSHQTNEGLVRLGALLRVAADLSDPVLAAGAQGYPPGVVQEYYSFIRENLDKITVVLNEPDALSLGREDLPRFWQGLLDRSRTQAPVIGVELFRNGRVVDHRTLDYRNPAFGVGAIAYSRAVTGIAGTWLAVWREAQGDLTRAPEHKVVRPQGARARGVAVGPREARR